MKEAVVAGSIAVAGVNGIACAVGLWTWYRGEVTDGPSARSFWVALRLGQGSAIALAVAVGSLAAAGRTPTESLFYLYALLPLAVAFIAEQLRVASAQTILDQRGLADAAAVGGLPEVEQHELVAAIMRRELGVMAASALVVTFLAIRAAGTAHGF